MMGFKINGFKFGPIEYTPAETKDSGNNIDFQNIFSTTDTGALNWYLSSSMAYWMLGVSDSVHDAVSRIAWAFAQIRPMLQDKDSGEYVKDHPALALLETTDMRFNEDQVKFEMMVSYCLTGECYPAITGNVKYEPISLYHYPANNISLSQGTDGYIATIIANYQNVVKNYNRAINPRFKTYVFETDDKLNQIMQIINNRKRNYLRAQSPLEGVYYQTITKYYGNMHNSSIVKNASRPGGLWSPTDGPMSQDIYESFKKEVRENFSNPTNAGRNIIAPRPVKYENLMNASTTRDMDFIKLIENSRNEIYSAYQIPLPLVSASTMTMNNYEIAISAFYDMAVIPRAKFIYKQLGDFILSRYVDGNRYRLVIDERTLPALKDRLFERSKMMRDVGAYSENEIRSESGYESIGEAGDKIYKPAMLIPSGDEDLDEYSNITNETTEQEDVEENADIIEDDK